jgi:CheY-like chemotaxis protein
VTLDADPLRLSQVLSNLLTNAAKYTDPGGHIELSGYLEGGLLCLSVQDDGIGMLPESLQHIFEMFSQAEGASTRSDGGLGIGLALVRGLVDLHKGTVEATSEGPGRGSKFMVRLPLAVSVPAAAAAAETDAPPVAGVGRRVLVADDNKDAADALAMLLELAGHEVRVAHGGRAALSLAQTFRPDVAILDVGMPELNGYEVAKELRRAPWGPRMRLIALTGWAQDEDRQRAKDAGFDRHFTKPVDADALEILLSP